VGIINYAGKLPVAVVLVWKGETIANALTDTLKNHVYAIANESVTEFIIKATGGAPLVISRKATAKAPFYDSKLNTFTTSPVPGDALDAFVALSAPSGTIDLTFSYRTFFDKMLEQDTRTDSDLHNLANPNNSSAILDTFTHSNAGGVVRITYKSATEKLVAVPFKLIDKQVTPGKRGKPPAVKLVLELDFLTGVNDARREAMRKLVAMDWSKLARYGSALTQDFVKVWRQNLYAYLANHTDKARGERFRQGILARHRIKAPDVLAKDLRDDIDLHIITANHWGEARESITTERHQRLISDLFGTLHQSAWYASPVAYIRDLGDDLGLDLKEICGPGSAIRGRSLRRARPDFLFDPGRHHRFPRRQGQACDLHRQRQHRPRLRRLQSGCDQGHPDQGHRRQQHAGVQGRRYRSLEFARDHGGQ
jgi:hypothetical protein